MKETMKRGKHRLLSLAAGILCLSPVWLSAQASSCIECHSEMGEELVESFKLDVHQKFGLSCSDCHGGNPAEEEADLAKDRSFRGAPERKDVPEFCASCHSDSVYMRDFNPNLRVDQLALYWTSRHGQRLKKGDTRVAVCTDCHGDHGILAGNHPKSLTFPWNIPETCGRCHSDKTLMQAYRLPADQVEEYRQSVHSRALFEKKDLSAPVCNDCHGNHGAAPPGVFSIAYVCRQCHPSTGELFLRSPHKKAFDEMEISECEACHGNHRILPPSDEMLGTGEEAICIQCHDPDSRPYAVAAAIKKSLDRFKDQIQEAETLLAQADRQGVNVSDPRFRLSEAITLLILVRNLSHGLDLAEIEAKIQEGEKVVSWVSDSGEAALKEARFRKSGLIVSTIFIFLLALALFLKIRDIEKRSRS